MQTKAKSVTARSYFFKAVSMASIYLEGTFGISALLVELRDECSGDIGWDNRNSGWGNRCRVFNVAYR
jgi:hypothetical protein